MVAKHTLLDVPVALCTFYTGTLRGASLARSALQPRHDIGSVVAKLPGNAVATRG